MTILADMVVRETLRPHTAMTRFTRRSMPDLRRAMFQAHKFVLDDDMSAFMADLATIPFNATHERRPDIFNAIRHGSRLPYPVTWIEYNSRVFRRRLLD